MYQLHGVTKLCGNVSEIIIPRGMRSGIHLAKEIKVTLGRHIWMSPGMNPDIVTGIERG